MAEQNWKSCFNCGNKIATGDGCYKCRKNNSNVIQFGLLESINTCNYYGEYKNWISEVTTSK
jgi:hypothetical protein